MEIVPSTFLALAAVILMIIRGPSRAVVIFMATTPFGAAAAFNLPAVGGATIGVTDLAAVAIFGLVFIMPKGPSRIAGTMRPWQPGFYLLLLGVFCVISAMFFPRLFLGETDVFSIARINNQNGIISLPLRPTTGNITQLFRMTLGIATFLALATLLRLRPDDKIIVTALTVATVINIGLGLLDLATFATGLQALMEPIRTANYSMLIESRMAGIKRMVGGFPEASSFGYYTLGLFGFWLQYWIAAPKSRRAPWFLAAISLVLLRSTSSAAYVAVAAFLMTFAAVVLLGNMRRTAGRRSVSIAASAGLLAWLAMLGLFAAYQMVAPITDYLDRTLFDKLTTSSGIERMSWNAQAWRNFIDTQTIGAGLGSIRASNWFLSCLGSIGTLGTFLFVVFLFAVLFLPTQPAEEGRSATIKGLKAGCVAMFMSAMLTHPTPDLGIFFFALAGLATGLSRGAALESVR